MADKWMFRMKIFPFLCAVASPGGGHCSTLPKPGA